MPFVTLRDFVAQQLQKPLSPPDFLAFLKSPLMCAMRLQSSSPSFSHTRLSPVGRRRCSGITLLELTVVIMVLLSMVSVLFFGAEAWKRGADRARCILQITEMQKCVRSFENLYGYAPGMTVPGLQSRIIGNGRFIQVTPVCPGYGAYTFGRTSGADVIPPMGTLYMECSPGSGTQHTLEPSSIF